MVSFWENNRIKGNWYERVSEKTEVLFCAIFVGNAIIHRFANFFEKKVVPILTWGGLRPGEKLYEELLVKTEELDKTENERKDVPPLFWKRINLSGINRGYILYLSHHQGMSYNDWQADMTCIWLKSRFGKLKRCKISGPRCLGIFWTGN